MRGGGLRRVSLKLEGELGGNRRNRRGREPAAVRARGDGNPSHCGGQGVGGVDLGFGEKPEGMWFWMGAGGPRPALCLWHFSWKDRRHLQREGTLCKRWVLGRDSEFPERSLKYV